eukprot:3768766-Rhodomonas_salina.2
MGRGEAEVRELLGREGGEDVVEHEGRVDQVRDCREQQSEQHPARRGQQHCDRLQAPTDRVSKCVAILRAGACLTDLVRLEHVLRQQLGVVILLTRRQGWAGSFFFMLGACTRERTSWFRRAFLRR